MQNPGMPNQCLLGGKFLELIITRCGEIKTFIMTADQIADTEI